MDAIKFLLLISIFTNNRRSLLSKQLPLVSSIRLLMVYNGFDNDSTSWSKLRYFSCGRLDLWPSRGYMKFIISWGRLKWDSDEFRSKLDIFIKCKVLLSFETEVSSDVGRATSLADCRASVKHWSVNSKV